jgi:hypothetical protein
VCACTEPPRLLHRKDPAGDGCSYDLLELCQAAGACSCALPKEVVASDCDKGRGSAVQHGEVQCTVLLHYAMPCHDVPCRDVLVVTVQCWRRLTVETQQQRLQELRGIAQALQASCRDLQGQLSGSEDARTQLQAEVQVRSPVAGGVLCCRCHALSPCLGMAHGHRASGWVVH